MNIKFTSKNIFQLTLILVRWILRVYSLKYPGRTECLFDLITRLDKIRQDRGIDACVLYIKDTRVALYNYLAGTPIKIKGLSQTRDLIPIVLGDLIPQIRRGSSPVILRMITTILSSTRALSLGKSPDLTPITDPCTGNLNIGHFMGDF